MDPSCDQGQSGVIDRSAAQIQTTWDFCLVLNKILTGVAARISPDAHNLTSCHSDEYIRRPAAL